MSVVSELTTPTVEDAVGSIQTNNKRDTKVYRCIITIFHDETSAEKIDPKSYFGVEWEKRIRVWVAQWESCKTTGRIHAHIYVEFERNTTMRFSRLQSLIARVSPKNDIKVPKRCSNKQRQGAVNYCNKPEAIDTEWRWCWGKGSLEIKFDEEFWNQRGKVESERVRQRKHIDSKPWWWTWDEIVQENDESKNLLCACSWGPKYHKGRLATQPRRLITDVIVYYGVGGSGKTTTAMLFDKKDDTEEPDSVRYYKRNYKDGKFWGGGACSYAGQRIIHLEEFQGQETLSEWKEICDIGHNGKMVNIKGGGTFLNHDTVIITSNIHPALWYRKALKKDPNHWNAFWRRITGVVFFPELRPDGSKNIAGQTDESGAIIPIHCVDQTGEWKELTSFDDGIEHAKKHWWIEEEGEEESVDRVWTYNAHEGVWMVNGELPTREDYQARKRARNN